MKSLKDIILERSGNIKFGCAMLYFNLPQMDKIHEMIDKEDIYDEEGFGLEDEPHCTLLYGFHSDKVQSSDVIQSIKKMDMPEDLKLKNASLFENEYDVLKFDVYAPNKELHAINTMLTDSFPYSTDYPNYHPHCTIAYVKKGMGKKYVDKFKDMDISVTPKSIVYSDADRTKITEEL